MNTVEQLLNLRHRLHRLANPSGQEEDTRNELLRFLRPIAHRCRTVNIGGSGLALIFSGRDPGPTILLRCEMDAVPVEETLALEYGSWTKGISHKCGHDGHMTILAAVALTLAEKPLSRGRVVLLFQPGEETGQGALAVVSDPRFAAITPDYAFALHNLPGYPLGSIIVKEGVFTSASRGMSITLTGRSAHAAQPETGNSPAEAMCRCVRTLPQLAQHHSLAGQGCQVTVVGARLGEKAFGTAPADAEVFVTLRSKSDAAMARLTQAAEKKINGIAADDDLACRIDYSDIFANTVNSAEAVAILKGCTLPDNLILLGEPFPWSEDFGRIAAVSEYAALFGIGAGRHCPELHDQHYDFPDELILPARDIFLHILTELLGDTTGPSKAQEIL